jgi:hypothetical protein
MAHRVVDVRAPRSGLESNSTRAQPMRSKARRAAAYFSRLLLLSEEDKQGKKRDMEAKASKHASKREHACAHACARARARARARGLMAALPGGGPAAEDGSELRSHACGVANKSKPAAASPASAASWSSPPARYARDIRRRAPASAAVQPQLEEGKQRKTTNGLALASGSNVKNGV